MINHVFISLSAVQIYFLSYCVIPEINIHTSPTEGIPSKTPTPLEIPIKLHTFGLTEPPPPRKFQSLLWGEYGYSLELHNTLAFIIIYRTVYCEHTT